MNYTQPIILSPRQLPDGAKVKLFSGRIITIVKIDHLVYAKTDNGYVMKLGDFKQFEYNHNRDMYYPIKEKPIWRKY